MLKKITKIKKNKINYLCWEDWSKRFVNGSNRKVAGALYGPNPALFAAATLTVYVTPSVKFANRSDGVVASIVTFVKILDRFNFVSTPRTMMWYVLSTPENLTFHIQISVW